VFVINHANADEVPQFNPRNVVACTPPANSRSPMDWLLGRDGGRGSGVVFGDGHGEYVGVAQLCEQLRKQEALELPAECGP